jgi:hypothetical protein
MDANGRPHMVYGDKRLFYAWHDGLSWQREIISTNWVFYPSIALDDLGRPHVAYAQPDGLWYAYRSDNEWHYVSLLEGAYFTSIALDSAGYPHIAYSSSNRLVYVHQNANGWYWYEVDTSPLFKVNLSLVLDAADHAHISYLNAGETVGYAHWTGSQWQLETFDAWPNPNLSWSSSSIALDSQDQPTIAYQIGSGIKLASRTNNGWNMITFNNDVFGSWVSLVIDGNDVPHLAYYDSQQDAQMYATRPADSWLITPVDTQFDAGHYAAIALDPQGQPHISYARYLGDAPSDLRYAHLEGAGWNVITVDTSTIYNQPSVAVDSEDWLHILYYERVAHRWHYLRQTATGWISETITSGMYPVDLGVSFLLDSNDEPHFAYVSNSSILHYVHRANNQWLDQQIASGVDKSQPVSLALDANDQPHIAFVSSVADAARYASFDTGNNVWVFETIYPINTYFDNSRIFLKFDSLDQPHVIFTDDYLGNIHYAHRPADQWLEEIVVAESDLASPLVLDSEGHPHFFYGEGWQKEVYHAYWTGSEWSSQLIDFPCHSFMALVIDSDDDLRFTAPGTVDEQEFLCYGYQQDENWIIHRVGSDSSWPGRSSLALTSEGTPVITYRDWLDRLNLARLAADIAYSPLIIKP